MGTRKGWRKQLCPCWLVEILGMNVNTTTARNIRVTYVEHVCESYFGPRPATGRRTFNLLSNPGQEDIRITSGKRTDQILTIFLLASSSVSQSRPR